MHKSVNAALRWVLPISGLLVLGPIAAIGIGALHAPDGGPDTSLLVGASPLSGILAALILLGVTVVLGVVTARLLGFAPALLACGFVVLWGAWSTGAAGELFRREPAALTPITLALEGAAVALTTLALGILLHRASRHRPHTIDRKTIGAMLTPAGLASIGTALVAGLACAWLVARTDLRGQAIFAAFAAGVGGAVAARLVGTAIHQDAPATAAYVGVALGAVLAPLITLVMPGAAALASTALAGDIPAPARLQPLDWAIAILWGVPTGLSWVGDLHHEPASPESPPSKPAPKSPAAA